MQSLALRVGTAWVSVLLPPTQLIWNQERKDMSFPESAYPPPGRAAIPTSPHHVPSLLSKAPLWSGILVSLYLGALAQCPPELS